MSVLPVYRPLRHRVPPNRPLCTRQFETRPGASPLHACNALALPSIPRYASSTKVCFPPPGRMAMFLKPRERKHLSTRSGGGTLITRQPGHIISDLYEVIQKRSLLTQLQFARKHVVDDVTAAAGYVNRRCIRCHRRRRPLEEIQPGRDPFRRGSPVARVQPESQESGGG